MTPDDVGILKTETLAAVEDGSQALTLKVAMADYDRIRPLIDGRVRPEGIDRYCKVLGDQCI